MIRVMLVDDHAVMRQGLTDLLSQAEGIEVVAAAPDGSDVVALAVQHQPQVVLMDLSMPGVDGVAATRELQRELPDVAVVVLTSFTDPDRIRAAVEAGAVGYLLKDSDPDELVRGVRAAARGDSPFDPRAARALLPLKRGSAPQERLTARELEVLALVGEGLPNKTIARRLGISEKTVKTHLSHVFDAIGVADRTSAALWAHRNGVLTEPEQ